MIQENKRNLLVGIFALVALAALAWLVFKFGELPQLVSGVRARTVWLHFPEAPGIEENAPVRFRGYKVGSVTKVQPPALLPDLKDPSRQYYQVVVQTHIGNEFAIPACALPKVYRRGLGGSFISFTLPSPLPADLAPLADNTRLPGSVAESSEFISETTQKKLDNLITSLMRLSGNLEDQVTDRPPELVDQDPDTPPNVTTVVMRLDATLANLNTIVGDLENQQNFKQGLADFSRLTGELRELVDGFRGFSENATSLIEKTSLTVEHIDHATGSANESLARTAERIQLAADEMAAALRSLNTILTTVASGQGTTGRLVNDPRLYESLLDAVENLSLTLDQLNDMIASWKDQGVKMKLK